MTRQEYIDHLTAVYRQANLADAESAEEWQVPQDAATHCNAIETIAADMMTPEEYQAWIDQI